MINLLDNSTHSIMNSMNILYPSYYHHNSKYLLSIYHGRPPCYPLYASLHLILVQLVEYYYDMSPFYMRMLSLTEANCLAKVMQVIYKQWSKNSKQGLSDLQFLPLTSI